jgi:CheY-like chemotaxis protein
MSVDHRSMTVLVAEDEPVSRRLMEASLTNWGYSVLVAEDGEQACALVSRGGVDVCLLDWEMPKKTGLEVCHFIRNTKGITPEPYIILLTAKNEPEYIARGYKAGANDYITKPFDRAALRKRIMDFSAGLNAPSKNKSNSGVTLA